MDRGPPWRCASSPNAARLMGAPRLIPVASAHIDGALYHGDSGTLFAETLVEGGAKVADPLDAQCRRARPDGLRRASASPSRMSATWRRRMMRGLSRLGCEPSWTCAPYQAGHRPRPGHAMSPGANPTPSSSAIPCSVRAPTAMAISSTSPAPSPAARRTTACTGRRTGVATLRDRRLGAVAAFRASESFYPVLGSLLGRVAGNAIARDRRAAGLHQAKTG